MLGRGFYDQIKDIIGLLPGDMQITLFSATMPKGIFLFIRYCWNMLKVYE